MKKRFHIYILSLLTILVSCAKSIDEQPVSEGTLDAFFKSRLDAEAALAGMYGEFQSTMIGEGQYNNRITWWGEARSDNWERRLSYSVNATNEIEFNGLTANNSYADYSSLYSTIGRANLLIKKLPEIKNFAAPGSPIALTPALEASYAAQAHAMRALCYFWIARVWGDAPIRTEPYLSINDQPEAPKESQERILAQAIADLELAYQLTTKNQTPTVWYLGEGAICSIMADIYMWKHDYDNAIVWFKRLFAAKAPTGKVYNASGALATGAGGASGDLQSGTTWNTQFVSPASSVESIFSIHWDFVANGCACMAGVSRTLNEPMIRMADPLWTEWPKVSTAVYGTTTATTDLRVRQTYNITSATSQPIRDRSFWKFYAGTFTAATATAGYTFVPTLYTSNLPGNEQTNVYIPLYRLSGMYLLYAEALNKIGDRANAVKYLNLIKGRAGVPLVEVSQFPTVNDLENEILKERQFELIGEGVRWFDLVRTDKVKEVMDPILIARQTAAGNATTGWGSDKRKYYWPFSTNVMYANSMLIQNEPYGGQ